MPAAPLPRTIDEAQALLAGAGYVAGRGLSTVVFLALKLGRPLFLEGEAGVGKTEIAKALAQALGRRLIRLQCYEGLDAAERGLRVELPGADGGDPHRRGRGLGRPPRADRGALLRALPDPPAAARGDAAAGRRRRRCC